MSEKEFLGKHCSRIEKLWPVDPLRPEASFHAVLGQLSTSLKSHSQMNVKDSLGDGSSDKINSTFVNEVNTSPSTQLRPDSASLRQINALYSLLDNRYKKKYLISQRALRPRFNEEYYTQLLAELEAAPRRSWISSVLRSLRGLVRLR